MPRGSQGWSSRGGDEEGRKAVTQSSRRCPGTAECTGGCAGQAWAGTGTGAVGVSLGMAPVRAGGAGMSQLWWRRQPQEQIQGGSLLSAWMCSIPQGPACCHGWKSPTVVLRFETKTFPGGGAEPVTVELSCPSSRGSGVGLGWEHLAGTAGACPKLSPAPCPCRGRRCQNREPEAELQGEGSGQSGVSGQRGTWRSRQGE